MMLCFQFCYYFSFIAKTLTKAIGVTLNSITIQMISAPVSIRSRNGVNTSLQSPDKLWDSAAAVLPSGAPNNTIGHSIVIIKKIMNGIVYILGTWCKWMMPWKGIGHVLIKISSQCTLIFNSLSTRDAVIK